MKKYNASMGQMAELQSQGAARNKDEEENYKVKKNFDNDDYIPLKLIIKRYYKKILSENLNIDKGSKKSLSKKMQEFRKGSKLENVNKNKKESFKSQGRVQRVLSHEIKPNLYFLNDILQ